MVIEPLRIVETVDSRTYEWELPGESGSRVMLELTQPFGCNEVRGKLTLPAAKACRVLLRASDASVITATSGSAATAATGGGSVKVAPAEWLVNGQFVLEPLAGRGMAYIMTLTCGEQVGGEDAGGVDAKTYELAFTTLVRYPYGRTFADYRQEVLRKNEESKVVLYWEEEVDVTPVRKRLQETDPALYLDHIIGSVVKAEMSPMEQAKAILSFLGGAVQHNAVYLNKQEGVRAMDRYEALIRQRDVFARQRKIADRECEVADAASAPTADDLACMDEATVLTLELGYTRCGFLNGFMTDALARRIGLRNEVFFSNGGHTSGKLLIEGEWYLSDADVYKTAYPLREDGALPALGWLFEADNLLLLDTVPGWSDSLPEDGWIRYPDGTRLTGVLGGGRAHADTGYVSKWFGGAAHYPPSVPLPLAALRLADEAAVLVQWIGSYDRDGDLRDYQIELGLAPGGTELGVFYTSHTWLKLPLHKLSLHKLSLHESALPSDDQPIYWRVRARDHHGADSAYAERIYYGASPEQRFLLSQLLPSNAEVPATDVKALEGFEVIGPSWPDGGLQHFVRKEGFDDFLGQTNLSRTELFALYSGYRAEPVLRIQDVTNYWFNGHMCRSLWERPLPAALTASESWRLELELAISRDGFGGTRMFPFLWIGTAGSYEAIGLLVDCATGTLHAAANLFGDWRKVAGEGLLLEGTRHIIALEWDAGRRALSFEVDGRKRGEEDCSLRGLDFALDSAFIATNPEGEFECLIYRLWLQRREGHA